MEHSLDYLRGRVGALESVNNVLTDIIKAQLSLAGKVDAWAQIGATIRMISDIPPFPRDTEAGRGFQEAVLEFADKFLDD